MILTRDGKEITAIYKQDGSEVEEVKDANGRLVYTNTREITGTLPLSFSSRGKPLTDYLISGNTIQDGTPTPEAPVDVQGCGVRTENLVPPDLYRNPMAMNGVVDGKTNYIPYSAGAVYVIPAASGETYTIKVHTGNETLGVLRCGFIGAETPTPVLLITQAKEILTAKNPTLTVTNSANNPYFTFQISGVYADQHGVSTVMVNIGSTALPYEPYGYKLPPTVNGTEYPIYLGFTESTRRIRKLVLTGDEEWTYITGGKHWTAVSGYLKSGLMCICSHYKAVENVSGSSFITNGQVGFYSSLADRLIFCDTTCTTTDDWKSYLAQQYAAGTPVTIWYVLATPETAVVNEPLMKIGNYADTISFAQSGVTIPTVNGANVLDMTSSVEPSKAYIKGKGIKQNGG